MVAIRVARDVEDAINRACRGVWNGGKVNHTGTRASASIVRSDGDRSFATRTGGTDGVVQARRVGSTMANDTDTRGNNPAGGENKGRMVRNLPYPKFLKRREEGRCFRCGGPFAPGHRCAEKNLRVLLLAEDEEEELEESSNLEVKPLELSACSAEGLTPPKTMKLTGLIGEKRVVVLIDSGASHNFISQRSMVEELGLRVVETPTYAVSLGDGCKKWTSGRCEKVGLKLGDVVVEEDMYVFELGGVDLILGIAWLAKLGEVVINWRDMSMQYVVAGEKMMIKGDPVLSRQLVDPNALAKIMDAESWFLVWEMCVVEQGTCGDVLGELTEEQQVEIRVVLHAHFRVFQKREGLPPSPDAQHRIVLKEGINPINVRPYRYPYLMKEEIEK
ncbi:hypothetical protein LR48_Vigan2444s000100 [Vigna angularis]|nr:hypothetical protein LR48_Vigan2444s000100 [Vigna angularis]